jgi:hypothetical protein
MNDEELKSVWDRLTGCGGEGKIGALANVPPGKQMELMRTKLKALDRDLWRRQAVVAGSVTLCIPVFAWFFLKTPLLVERIGDGIVMASLALILWRVLRAGRGRAQPPADAPFMEWLRHDLGKVRSECELWGTALWWYVLPPWIGIIVSCWGLGDLSSRIGYSALMTGVYVFVWKMIQSSVRKHWLPLKEELDLLLQSEQSATESQE